MEPSFQRYLIDKGVGKRAVEVLTTEKVLSRRIYTSLKEDHIVRLLKCEGWSIGSHAIIWSCGSLRALHLVRNYCLVDLIMMT